MAWVYMLRGASGRYYIGSTVDLDERMEQHRRGHTHTTRRLGGDLKIAAAVETATLPEARTLERELKRKKSPRLALHLLQQKRDGRKSGPESIGVAPGFESQPTHHFETLGKC